MKKGLFTMNHTLKENRLFFGVKFPKGKKEGVRLYDAAGLNAAVGTDKESAENDFDKFMPWSEMRRCNTVKVGAERIPTRYQGNDGFTNTEADVFVYVPRFYYSRTYNAKGDEIVKVCSDPFEGGDVPRKFKRADGTIRSFVFLAAYTAGVKDGRLVSRAGLEPFSTSLNGFMKLTETLDDLRIESTLDDEIKNVLLDVEFATRDPQSIMAGAVSSDRVWDSGACDSVLSSSGSPGDNSSGKFPCIWRGVENPWGNTFRFRWNVLVKDRVPYILGDPAKYARGEVTEDYIPLDYKLSRHDGWAHKLGFDERFPDVQIPVEVADSYEESAFGCYFWQWSEGIYTLLVGGNVDNARYAGARYCNVNYAPSNSNWNYCAALSPA